MGAAAAVVAVAAVVLLRAVVARGQPGPRPEAIQRRHIATLSFARFAAEHLRTGEPVIVEGAAAGPGPAGPWAALGWTLPSLRTRFPAAGFGDAGLTTLPPGMAEALKGDYGVPAFLRNPSSRGPEHGIRQSEPYVFTAAHSPEHLDSGCLQSWVLQIQGSKQWTLRFLTGSSNSSDGMTAHQARRLVGVLGPGDILYFTPGWRHETRLVDHPRAEELIEAGDSQHALSLSIYFEVTQVAAGDDAESGHANGPGTGSGSGTGVSVAAHDCQPTSLYARHQHVLLHQPEYCACGRAWSLLGPVEHEAFTSTVCQALLDGLDGVECPGDTAYTACAPCPRVCGVADGSCADRDACTIRCACPADRPVFDPRLELCLASAADCTLGPSGPSGDAGLPPRAEL